MTPDQHRDRAIELATRVYQATSDYNALAQVAIVHALLSTQVTLEPAQYVEGRAARPMTRDGWLVLLALCATVIAVVWLVTR